MPGSVLPDSCPSLYYLARSLAITGRARAAYDDATRDSQTCAVEPTSETRSSNHPPYRAILLLPTIKRRTARLFPQRSSAPVALRHPLRNHPLALTRDPARWRPVARTSARQAVQV